jgi:hypothetical protein
MSAQRCSSIARLALALTVLSHSSAHGQELARYTGTLDRRLPTIATAALSLTVFSRTDSSFEGYVSVGPPLGRTGEMSGWFVRDSLELVSMSQTGDSIRWTCAHGGIHLTGTYAVLAGAGIGQSGSWTLELAQGTALARPGGTGGESISVLRTDLPWWLLLATVLLAFVWGFWRIWRQGEHRRVEWTVPLTDTEARLRGVGGWMALFLFGQIAAILLSLRRIVAIISGADASAWNLGAIIPGHRPTLAMEVIVHLARVIVPTVAILLTVRLDRRARPWWLLWLCMLFLYGACDLVATAGLPATFSTLAGHDAGAHAAISQQSGRTRNLQLLAYSAIWFLYWYRSVRVRINFGSDREPVIALQSREMSRGLM